MGGLSNGPNADSYTSSYPQIAGVQKSVFEIAAKQLEIHLVSMGT